MSDDKAKDGGIKIICDNKKAFHDYFIEEKWEAGIVLTGTEVKSLREGKANLRDAHAVFTRNELYLLNAHINTYRQGNRENHETLRTRKLLLHRAELSKLWTRSEIKGYTIIPTKMYFRNGLAKIEIGLGRGKKSYDKRQVEKEKEAKRDLARLTRKATR